MTARHVFQADPSVPADHRGRRVCALPGCHLPAGNVCHELPDTPEQQESRRRAGDDTDTSEEG